MTIDKIKAPFPYFGGKSRVAPIIWEAFGTVSNYIEPFAGSLAVLLHNSNIPKIETINDKDCFVSNFWRSLIFDPDKVIEFADYPVHENELQARNKYLLSSSTIEFKNKMNSDPDFYDPKIAGYWIYGQSASVGSNWMNTKGNKALPMLSSAGGGIQGLKFSILDQFKKLQERLKRVRVCCGDWSRITTPSITFNSKGLSPKDITAVFLDPPYDYANRDKVYSTESNVFKDVCDWAIANGDLPNARIAVCGYEGFEFPDNWQTYAWKANGGLANLGNTRGKDNANKERIWFSPNCIKL